MVKIVIRQALVLMIVLGTVRSGVCTSVPQAIPAVYARIAQDVCGGPIQSPVATVLWLDMDCRHCATLSTLFLDLQSVFRNRLQVMIKHVPAADAPHVIRAHHALIAAEQRNCFWPMFQTIMSHRSTGTPWEIPDLAPIIGLNPTDFERMMQDPGLLQRIQSDRVEALAMGLEATPTLFVNGYRLTGITEIRNLTDALIRRSTALEKMDLHVDSPSRVTGNARAPVTVTMFLDFDCCHSRDLFRVLEELDGEPDIPSFRWVFRHYPLSSDAAMKHAACIAAGEQGQFWDMARILWSTPQLLTPSDLHPYAREIGLDMDWFDVSLADPRCTDQIEMDRELGAELGLEAAPTLFFQHVQVTGHPGRDRIIRILNNMSDPLTGSRTEEEISPGD